MRDWNVLRAVEAEQMLVSVCVCVLLYACAEVA